MTTLLPTVPLGHTGMQLTRTGFARSFVAVAVGGAIIASLSAGLGLLAAG